MARDCQEVALPQGNDRDDALASVGHAPPAKRTSGGDSRWAYGCDSIGERLAEGASPHPGVLLPLAVLTAAAGAGLAGDNPRPMRVIGVLTASRLAMQWVGGDRQWQAVLLARNCPRRGPPVNV